MAGEQRTRARTVNRYTAAGGGKRPRAKNWLAVNTAYLPVVNGLMAPVFSTEKLRLAATPPRMDSLTPRLPGSAGAVVYAETSTSERNTGPSRKPRTCVRVEVYHHQPFVCGVGSGLVAVVVDTRAGFHPEKKNYGRRAAVAKNFGNTRNKGLIRPTAERIIHPPPAHPEHSSGVVAGRPRWHRRRRDGHLGSQQNAPHPGLQDRRSSPGAPRPGIRRHDPVVFDPRRHCHRRRQRLPHHLQRRRLGRT